MDNVVVGDALATPLTEDDTDAVYVGIGYMEPLALCVDV